MCNHTCIRDTSKQCSALKQRKSYTAGNVHRCLHCTFSSLFWVLGAGRDKKNAALWKYFPKYSPASLTAGWYPDILIQERMSLTAFNFSFEAAFGFVFLKNINIILFVVATKNGVPLCLMLYILLPPWTPNPKAALRVLFCLHISQVFKHHLYGAKYCR